MLLVAGGAGGGAYIRCVAGAGGGDSWTVGKRASDGDADVNYKNGTNVTFTGSQGGKGKDYNNNTGNQRGGSGGHGGGFKAVSILAGQQQTYAVVVPVGVILPKDKAIPQQRVALRLAAMAKSSLLGTAPLILKYTKQ